MIAGVALKMWCLIYEVKFWRSVFVLLTDAVTKVFSFGFQYYGPVSVVTVKISQYFMGCLFLKSIHLVQTF